LENEAAKKLDLLLSQLFHNIEQEFKKCGRPLDASNVFKVVFSLLAAKLLKDRNVATSVNIDFSHPQTALQTVSSHYGASLKELTASIPANILRATSHEVAQSFLFNNISVDTLTYIYENTFVSKESRKSYGIHSTPSYIADYVLSQIPIETLPQTQWHATDPMSGHGIFLIAAMRRMRDLLPQDWSGRQRHKYFVSHLHGIEIEKFSVEVARMCLMLADFPELNGWDLVNDDIFSGKILETAIAKTTIFIGNPPFEDIENKVPAVPKPVELLRRALPVLPDEAFIGLVLPRSFTDGFEYAKERDKILESFELISLTTLPDRIFTHSEMETVVLVAQKRRARKSVNVMYREVRDDERNDFRTKRRVSWEDSVPQNYLREKVQGRLFIPFLRELWEILEDNQKVSSIVEIKKGVEYQLNIDLSDVIYSTPRPNSKRGIVRRSSGFYQYQALDTVYMSTEKQFRRRETSASWDLPWAEPKLILPASRMSRGPWRFAAALDKEGILANRLFYGVWPKANDVEIEVLAAIFNSPIAAAYVYSHSSQRTVTGGVYKDIPLPILSPESKQVIHFLVLGYLEAVQNDVEKAKMLLLQIDAVILRQYDLPPRLERQLLDVFWGAQRPVPFQFTGYIPPETASWIPLHVYISERFNTSTPEIIMQRIPIISDSEFLNYLKGLGREDS
jgi:type I restriction-modification system DNA methylase subunit